MEQLSMSLPLQAIPYEKYRDLAVASATLYYDFLMEKVKDDPFAGAKVIDILDEPAPGNIPYYYRLAVSEKIAFPDAVRIFIKNKPDWNLNICKVMNSVRNNHYVLVYDKSQRIDWFHTLNPGDIKLVSDMKFLIERLRDFYLQTSFRFTPPAPAQLPELEQKLLISLSEEQRAAIQTVFQSPVSFISGAPGTGKTKAVLAQCILRYVMNGKRVFLLAPTNNAIEQMLRGILPILRDAGIDLTKVYRLGTSTEQFASEYPEVVGDSSLQSLQESLIQQQAILKEAQAKVHRLRKEHSEIRTTLDSWNNAASIIRPLIERYNETRGKYAEASSEIRRQRAALREFQTKHESASSDLQRTTAMLETCEATISDLLKQSNQLGHWFWNKKKRTRLLDEVASLQPHYQRCLESCSSAISAHSAAKQELEAANASLSAALRHRSNLGKESKELATRIKRAVPVHPVFLSWAHTAFDKDAISMQEIEGHIYSWRQKCIEIDAEIEKYSVVSIEDELRSVEDQLNNVANSAKSIQRRNALVLAGTIDSSLTTLQAFASGNAELPVEHVFLDEAGYTALIRGMTAFACGSPVTFLGDLKQLPPVCEMNKIDPDKAPVCLWSLPVAYCFDLIYGNPGKLYWECFQNNAPPFFPPETHAALNVSYRFGPVLAEYLDKHIYHSGFTGKGGDFQISVIHCQHRPGKKNWTSISEAEAILYLMSSLNTNDVAILTPYRNQVELIRYHFPKAFRDNVLTVHRSQGCEWDTVILSVVDGKSPFLTDIRKLKGQQLLNTAISRTKRHLVLVCDTEIWSRMPGQLIYDLLILNRNRELPPP